MTRRAIRSNAGQADIIELIFETPGAVCGGHPGAWPTDKESTMSDSMPREWRPVVGFEGRYEVSDYGDVRSLPRTTVAKDGRVWSFPGCSMVHTIRKDSGYHVVTLRDEQRKKQRKVHQLVCEAFHGPRPSPKHHVRHLNGDKDDNRLVNLVWGTASENVRDSLRHNTQWQSRKTHCQKGHPYDEENTYLARGRRHCRTCMKESGSARSAQIRAARTACPKGHLYDSVSKNGRRYCARCASEQGRRAGLSQKKRQEAA